MKGEIVMYEINGVTVNRYNAIPSAPVYVSPLSREIDGVSVTALRRMNANNNASSLAVDVCKSLAKIAKNVVQKFKV